MKIKVGELFNRPVVLGNENEFEKHEISLKDLLEGKLSLDDIKNN